MTIASKDMRKKKKKAAKKSNFLQVSRIGNPGIGPGRKSIARWLRKLRGQ